MIGNWVSNKNGEPVRVVNINEATIQVESDSTSTTDHHVSNFLGIDLTPEIMEKAGFEKRIDSKIILPLKRDRYTCYLWLEFIDDRAYLLTADDGHDYHLLDDIQHLHRLQNVYFALMGVELPVEL
jgi:hypothetical protein